MGYLKYKDALRGQDPQEFLDVALGISRIHMLQDQSGINEVKMLRWEEGQIILIVQVVVTAIGIRIYSFCERNHGGSNVHAPALIKPRTQGLRRSADTAPEIQSPV